MCVCVCGVCVQACICTCGCACVCRNGRLGAASGGLKVSLRRGVNTGLHAGRTDPGEVKASGGERRDPLIAPGTRSRP